LAVRPGRPPSAGSSARPPAGASAGQQAGSSAGPPSGPPAAELIAAGFELENADAPLLHHGINLADIAHVLDLQLAGVIPPDAARRMLGLLLETLQIPAEQFPYQPEYGEPYNSRERYFAGRAGDVAGWLHAGRPRREAMRIAFRLHLRDALVDLIEAAADLAAELGAVSAAHAGTLMADQTYLQHAQPSTFGHYLLSFAFPVLREGRRLDEALAWTDASPGGAGCVNGTRLRSDRANVARLLGFRGIAEHTRDAMWQTDGLFDMIGAATGLLVTQSKLAEDLEIWASQEFDYVTLADAYSRASVLMPQKRNPYALSIIRGAAGTMIGRLTGLLAVAKTPSARSDNLIFAYGEVPRSLGLALRTTRLSQGVVRTLEVNSGRMSAVLQAGFSQATDIAEYIMQACGIDYRTAYRVVGHAVREASAAGLRGIDIDGPLLDRAAMAVTGRSLHLTGHDLGAVLDPLQIVQSRTGLGGAAPGEVRRMAADVRQQAAGLAAGAGQWRAAYRQAEDALIAAARRCAGHGADEDGHGDGDSLREHGRGGSGK
jgi:argininosuccinate lyase